MDKKQYGGLKREALTNMIKILDFENISISNCELEFGFDFSHFEILHTLDPHNNLRLHHNSILLFCQ